MHGTFPLWDGEGVGTKYYDCSYKKKAFLMFVPFLPVTRFRHSFQGKDIIKSQVWEGLESLTLTRL